MLSSAFAMDFPNNENIIVHKKVKKYDGLTFLDQNNEQINLDEFQGKLILLNFWASWCAPCKKEMPSLDRLQSNDILNNIKIFPINVGRDTTEKAERFFKELKIQNLDIYFDSPNTLAKEFSLRGIPTTILINKKGEEFARILGSIDFDEKKFIDWLSSYN
tara:strand:+ start:475 stop:957 length:483 start_codon:yes stop_codon:yes gene_type:complete